MVTVKELSTKVDKLTMLVKSLEHKLQELKAECDSKHVTFARKDSAKQKNKDKFKDVIPTNVDEIDTERKSCHKCEAVFESMKELKQHIESKHPKQIKCTSCEFTSSRMIDLEKHIKECHQEDEPFNCDECGKKFVHKWRLNKQSF